VNEKIEGFFAVCRDSGLTGEQSTAWAIAEVLTGQVSVYNQKGMCYHQPTKKWAPALQRKRAVLDAQNVRH